MESARRAHRQLPRHDAQRDGTGEGALRGPPGGGGGRDQPLAGEARARRDRGGVRNPAARARSGRGDAPRRPSPARPPVHRRSGPAAGHAFQRRQAGPVRARRRGRGLRRGGPDDRARVRHATRAPGLHRAPRLPRQRVRGRPSRALGEHPGPLLGARTLRPPARLGDVAHPGDRGGDRRRLRRQDGGLPRAALARALGQGLPAGQDADDPRRSLPGHRTDLGRPRAGEDRRHPRRAHHRGRRGARVPGGRLPGLAGAAGRDERLRPLRARPRAHRGLRRGRQPPQGRGLPCPRGPDRGVRGGVDARRARPRARPGPAGAAPSQRGARGQPVELRPEVRPHRHGGDPRGGEGPTPTTTPPSGPTRAAGSPPGSGSTSGARPARR